MQNITSLMLAHMIGEVHDLFGQIAPVKLSYI